MNSTVSFIAITLTLIAILLLAVIAAMANAIVSLAAAPKQSERPGEPTSSGNLPEMENAHRYSKALPLLLAGSPTGSSDSIPIFIYAAILVIVVELLVIAGMFRAIKRLVNIQLGTASVPRTKTATIFVRVKAWWKNKQAKPEDKEKEEAGIDLGHNYDGIRELDHPIPRWWSLAFLFSIIFAAAYLYRYHVARSAPLQLAEYEQEMAAAEKAHAEYLKKTANTVDESTVTMLGDKDIAEGAGVFKTYCAACHGQEGGGGIGPNLTDDYWLHGGSIGDVFKTIKYGVPDKGMIAWQDQLTPMQIARLASYIKSINGSDPPGAKEPQGELTEEVASPAETAGIL